MGLELAKMWCRIRGDSSQLPADMDKARRIAEGGMSQLVSHASGMMARFIGSYASYQTLIGGLMQAGKFEQTTIAFETMIGSVEETKKTLADLTEFAALTPFEMPEIESAARGLIQFGERGDQLMETLNMLGNAASGSSTPFGFLALVFNQIRGVGKLLTQDFRQLSTRGILSLQDIADHYKVTTQEAQTMLSKGRISFEDVRDIFKGLSAEGGRFHNLMERQSKSLLGLWSTLQDAMNLARRALGEGLLPVAKMFVGTAIQAVEVIRAWVTDHKELAAYSMAATTGILAMAGAFKALRIAGISAGRAIQMALVGTGIGIALVAVGVAIGAIVAWIHKMIAAWSENEETMAKWKAIGQRFIDAWENIKKAVAIAVQVFIQAFKTILARFGVSEEWLKSFPDTIQGIFLGAAEYVSKFALRASQWILLVAENWDSVWNAMGGIVKVAMSYLGDIFLNYTTKFLPQAWGYMLNRLVEAFMWFGEKVGEFMTMVAQGIIELFQKVPSLVMAALRGDADMAQGLMGVFRDAISGFEAGIKGEAPKIEDIFTPSERTKQIWQDEVAGVWDKIRFGGMMEKARPVPVIDFDVEESKEKAAEVGEEIAKAAASFMPEVGARLALPDLGKKIQDALLGGGKDAKDDKRNQLLEMGVKKQDELIAAVREGKTEGPARVG